MQEAKQAQPSNAQRPEFEILAQFIKDLSFESPSTPQIFFEKNLQAQPSLNVNLEVKTQKIGEEIYEAILTVKVNNTIEQKPLFIVDLSYGAVVAIHTKDEEKIKNYITKTTPAHLFPFIREIVAALTRESGFAPFVLAPIDFSQVAFQQTAAPGTAPQAPVNKA